MLIINNKKILFHFFSGLHILLCLFNYKWLRRVWGSRWCQELSPFPMLPGGLLSACFAFVCLSITRGPVNGVNTAEERVILNNLSPKPSPSDIALLSSITLHFIRDSKKLGQEEKLLPMYLFIYICYAQNTFYFNLFLPGCLAVILSVVLLNQVFLPCFSAV